MKQFTQETEALIIRLEQGMKLTPDEYAQIVMANKPYLIAIETEVEALGYGEMELKLTVRAGQVEKICFWKGKTWLKEKAR
jgi:hypothetical protein